MKKEIKLDSIKNFLKTELDSNSLLERKQFNSQIALQEQEDRTFIAKISSNSCDRDGDILSPNGCDTIEYETNPIVCWNHSYSTAPIGKVLALQKTNDAIYIKVQMANTPFATELWELVKGGFLRTTSIGFIAKNALLRGTAAFNKYVKDTGLKIDDAVKRIVTDFIMIESSLVPIPANKDALILAYSNKSIKLDNKLAKDFGLNVAEEITEEGKAVENVENVEQVKVEEVVKVEDKVEEEVKNEQTETTETTVEDTAESQPANTANTVVTNVETPITTEPVKVEQVTTEQPTVKVETPEPVKVEEPVEPVERVVTPIRVWQPIRIGSLAINEELVEMAKAYKAGKIV